VGFLPFPICPAGAALVFGSSHLLPEAATLDATPI
jgi:hypothetical protein